MLRWHAHTGLHTHTVCSRGNRKASPLIAAVLVSSSLIIGSASWLDHKTNSLIEVGMSGIIPRCYSRLCVCLWQRKFLNMCVLYYPVHCTEWFLICWNEIIYARGFTSPSAGLFSFLCFPPNDQQTFLLDIHLYPLLTVTQMVGADGQCCPPVELKHVNRFSRNINSLTVGK